MPDYYCIVRHVNRHCSGATYSQFCIKHFAKKAKKNANYPKKFPQKQRKNPLLETLKTENTLKKTNVTSIKQQCQKRALDSGRHYSQNQE